jgi:hypothetical protein
MENHKAHRTDELDGTAFETPENKFRRYSLMGSQIK